MLAHILVWFLAYVLGKTLAPLCREVNQGDEPRRVFDKFRELRMVDVIFPISERIQVRRRCVNRPNEHQKVLLQRLGRKLTKSFQTNEMEGRLSGFARWKITCYVNHG